jgi:hypothetical protein
MRSLAILLAVGACSGGQKPAAQSEAESFACKDRLASYVASHHMGGDEVGVQMDCKEAGPRIKRWRVDKKGTRQEDARGLSPGEFDKVWNEIDGTGWVNLKDCANGTNGKQDPVFVFDVRDDQNKASFQCQSMSMPYPYNGISDPLDLAAQAGGGQLGDPEPAEMKALDKKKPR